MKKNNFQLLEEEIIGKYGSPRESVFSSLKENLKFFKFIGDLLELFFPNVIKLFVQMSGGAPRQFVKRKKEKNGINRENKVRYPNLDSEHPRNKKNATL